MKYKQPPLILQGTATKNMLTHIVWSRDGHKQIDSTTRHFYPIINITGSTADNFLHRELKLVSVQSIA